MQIKIVLWFPAYQRASPLLTMTQKTLMVQHKRRRNTMNAFFRLGGRCCLRFLVEEIKMKAQGSNEILYLGSMKLTKNIAAPHFKLTDIYDRTIDLNDYRAKKGLIGFLRHAGCPFCNIRVHTL